MKKTTLLAPLLAGLLQITFASSTKTSSVSNTLGKGNSIVKYGQCWVFSSVLSASAKNESIDGLNEITVTQSTNSKTAIFGVVLGINNTKKGDPSPITALLVSGDLKATATITIRSSKTNTTLVDVDATTNKSTGKTEFIYSAKLTDPEFEWYVEDISFKITNQCKQTFHFTTNFKGKKAEATFDAKVNLDGIDVCNNKFEVKNLSFKGVPCDLTVESGICLFNGQKTISVDFALDETNSIAAELEMQVSVADCKGNIKTLNLIPTYNTKTGLYETNFTVSASEECKYQLLRAMIQVNTQCEDFSQFNADISSAIVNADKTGWDFNVQKGDGCDTKLKVDYLAFTGSTITINGGDLIIHDDATFTLRLGVPTRSITNIGSAAEMTVLDCKGNSKTIKVHLNYNSKTGLFESGMNLSASKDCTWEIIDLKIILTSPCNEVRTYEATASELIKGGPSGTTDEITALYDYKKYKDSCDVKYKLTEAELQVQDKSGYLSMAVSLGCEKGSDIPDKLIIIAEITNCKNDIKYIEISLKNDSKTGLWSGSEGLPQSKECTWAIIGLKVLAKNACGDKYYWDPNKFELKPIKGSSGSYMTFLKLKRNASAEH